MIKAMIAGSVALALPAGAMAQEARPQAQIEAVVRCLDVGATEERVRCYDRAATALREGLRRGTVVVADAAAEPPVTPARVEGRVTSASTPGGRWELVLDNGQTWRTAEGRQQRPPAPGTRVRIERNFIGNYWMRVGGEGRYRVVRVQ